MSNWCSSHPCDYGRGGQSCMNCGASKPDAELPPADAQAPGPIVPADTIEPCLSLGIPRDDATRKSMPVFDGLLMYFPLACLAVSEVSKAGNEQHNPGEPLHWARGKSMDQMNTALRHLMDHGMGNRFDWADLDGHEVCTGRHLAKAAWRILAALQLDIEAEFREAIDLSSVKKT